MNSKETNSGDASQQRGQFEVGLFVPRGWGDFLSPGTSPVPPKDSRTQLTTAGAAAGPPPWGWNPPKPVLLRTQLGKT